MRRRVARFGEKGLKVKNIPSRYFDLLDDVAEKISDLIYDSVKNISVYDERMMDIYSYVLNTIMTYVPFNESLLYERMEKLVGRGISAVIEFLVAYKLYNRLMPAFDQTNTYVTTYIGRMKKLSPKQEENLRKILDQVRYKIKERNWGEPGLVVVLFPKYKNKMETIVFTKEDLYDAKQIVFAPQTVYVTVAEEKMVVEKNNGEKTVRIIRLKNTDIPKFIEKIKEMIKNGENEGKIELEGSGTLYIYFPAVAMLEKTKIKELNLL